MPNEITLSDVHQTVVDILDTLREFSTNVDHRFATLEFDVATLKSEMAIVKTTMVTKDYLDEKIVDLRGDLMLFLRKEDQKVNTVVDVLHVRKVISENDAARVFSAGPFFQN